ncbi:unnamed protein product [Paramecium octaurelia]|uniref:Uncharacterized protein n=1 Tax=Paramecium octaurelia TaxID=43137 RepID=A0A8S1TP94_PAROT|nr:unnamed protein product [Paramecium octaurelia]
MYFGTAQRDKSLVSGDVHNLDYKYLWSLRSEHSCWVFCQTRYCENKQLKDDVTQKKNRKQKQQQPKDEKPKEQVKEAKKIQPNEKDNDNVYQLHNMKIIKIALFKWIKIYFCVRVYFKGSGFNSYIKILC